MFDPKNGLKVAVGVAPVAIGTTGTGQVGKIIDRSGYLGPVMFSIGYGSVTATAAAFTVTVKEGDATGAMTSAADIDLIGTEAAAGLAAAASRTSGTSKNVVKTVGYKGAKRYVQCGVKSTTTAGTPVSINAVLQPASRPAS